MRTTTNLKLTTAGVAALGRTVFNIYNESQEAINRTDAGMRLKENVEKSGVWAGAMDSGDELSSWVANSMRTKDKVVPVVSADI